MSTQTNTHTGRSRSNGNGNGNGETQWNTAPDGADLNEHIEHHREEIDRTLSALEGKLSASDLIDDVLRNMNAGPGQFVTNLGTAVRDNPIPITLIGVGLAWLMLGQGDGTGRLREKIAERGSSEDEDADDSSIDDLSLSDLYAFCLRREYPFDEDEVECILFEDLGPEAATEYCGGAFGSQAKGRTNGGAGLSQQAGGAHDDAKSRIDRTRLRMSAGADDVRAHASEARRKAMKRAKSALHAVSEGAQRAAEHTGDLFDRYPLSVLALGLAAGAALGAGMPSTTAEDRLMGERSDALKQQAGDAAHDGLDEAKGVAKAATAAARDEAHEQELDPDALIDKGLAVKDRAFEAARQASASPA